ncbi:MAG: response regulator [Desulfatibacillaceae bacterium]
MSIKVLIVDDEKEFAQALAERLRMRDFHVDTVYTGDEALARLRDNGSEYDVVVLDVMMPGTSGEETLRRIKRDLPLMEVIMLTGHATVESAIEGMKLGAYDYLMKPAEARELADKLRKAYARKKEHEDRIREAEIDRITKTRGW